MADVVFSRRQAVAFSPLGADGEPVPRAYTVAPLTQLERADYHADLAALNAVPPGRARLLEAVRDAVRDLAPSNQTEILAVVDDFEAIEGDADADPEERRQARRRYELVESSVLADPTVSMLVARGMRFASVGSYLTARLALRGWSGPGLPPFKRVQGRVPDALLEAVPEAEMRQVGERAAVLSVVGEDAEKNSGPPSPSSGTPTPSTAD